MEEITTSENSNFYLTKESQFFLKETAKWAYFLSILGFVGVGLLVFLALFMGTIFSKLGAMGGSASMFSRMGMGGLMTTMYIILAAIYFFPVYYLYQFSSKLKAAFSAQDNEKLNNSFEYLKSHYKFIGILAIIMFFFYLVIFLFSFMGILLSHF